MCKIDFCLKYISIIMIFLVLIAIIPYSVKAEDTISGLKGKYSDLEKKQAELQKKIDETAKNLKETQEYQNILSEQIEVLQQKIDVKNQEINETNKNIEKKIEEIELKQKEYDDTLELFKKRMRAMYMTGSDSLLEVLLSSKNFSQFVTRSDMVERVSKHDNDMLEKLAKQHKKLEEAKTDLENNKKALERSKADLNSSVTTLNIKYRESDEYKEILNKHQKINKEQQAELSAALAEIDNQIKEAIEKARQEALRKAREEAERKRREEEAKNKQSGSQNNGSSGKVDTTSYVGGEFLWPVPGFSTISSYYGEPRGGMKHLGMDIAGGGRNIRGKNILAANSGVVIIATQTWVYGKYLVIDHGGGKSTLYAHCDSLYASVGQTVTKGQKIAAVGNTGNSTGPHLHFEIRINGNAVNPLSYFSKRG